MNIKKVKTGDNPPEFVNVLVEIPQGSLVKYELDKESGFIMADRFHYTSMPYPFNYGFIPNTMAEDDDPVDVMVVSSQPLAIGTIISVRIIGMLEMEDEAGVDTKIIAVPTIKVDPFYAHIEDISDLDEPTQNKIKHFFDHYKELEPNKWVKTKEFLGKGEALKSIQDAMEK
ncbi:inorganic diphosphatase [Candidatus Roizmanbacteria bacterium CG11_big_fil_rev_8_21_14_0_20_36_8]|uniref:Inorganic pyrophosphatase n=1 Tax=Candidatus Roizmanbacteria bacterium CG11_big_fil_rev_8_21_14_0_20_36_8 TaxID=1974856 RepID=A0A2M6IUS8_9BACT|nr:MAG: inorganic diphosphatase [Candidatus Roizmanbacteria bacterium CG11_big_fil_rev_8_21_14_0_20_36_8]